MVMGQHPFQVLPVCLPFFRGFHPASIFHDKFDKEEPAAQASEPANPETESAKEEA